MICNFCGVLSVYEDKCSACLEPLGELLEFYDIKLKGWECRTCRRFNGEEKETRHECSACGAFRPTTRTKRKKP